jgi:hypothetical protein
MDHGACEADKNDLAPAVFVAICVTKKKISESGESAECHFACQLHFVSEIFSRLVGAKSVSRQWKIGSETASASAFPSATWERGVLSMEQAVMQSWSHEKGSGW